jgi:hypothetical protein
MVYPATQVFFHKRQLWPSVHQNFLNTNRFLDILNLMLTEVLKPNSKLVLQLVIGITGNTYATSSDSE